MRQRLLKKRKSGCKFPKTVERKRTSQKATKPHLELLSWGVTSEHHIFSLCTLQLVHVPYSASRCFFPAGSQSTHSVLWTARVLSAVFSLWAVSWLLSGTTLGVSPPVHLALHLWQAGPKALGDLLAQ